VSDHHKYTIAGTTYYAVGSCLYVETGDLDGHEEVDEHNVHLYDDRPCRLEWGGSIHSSVRVNPLDWEIDSAWKHIPTEQFAPVPRLERLKPDDIHECPDCGSWAGPIEEEPQCIHCGCGYDFDVDEEEEVDADA